MTPEQIEQLLIYLKRRLTEASTVEYIPNRGIVTLEPIEGWMQCDYNGTETITIKINGGAMDT